MTVRRLLIALAVLPVLATPAPAESVYVTTAADEVGHAWLFGSRNSASATCWLAVPAHVVRSFDGTRLLPLRFKAGEWGESGVPVGVTDIPGAREAAGSDDLAFAPVAVGPEPSECLDRLGLPSFAYQAALRRRDPLHVFSLLPGSFGDFGVTVETGMSGDAGLLRLGAVDPADAASYFKQGLSGSTVTVSRTAGVEPFAMILSIDDGQALSLRFDRIRAAFELVEAAALAAHRDEISTSTGLPYSIESFEGITRGDGPAASFAAEGGCWRVAPEGGKQTVSLVVLPDEGALRGLTVLQAEGCGVAPAKVVVQQRPRGKTGWSQAASCTTLPAETGIAACRLDFRSARELRITISTKGETGLSGLRLY